MLRPCQTSDRKCFLPLIDQVKHLTYGVISFTVTNNNLNINAKKKKKNTEQKNQQEQPILLVIATGLLTTSITDPVGCQRRSIHLMFLTKNVVTGFGG